MKPEEVKAFFKTLYAFHKATRMSCMSLHTWLKVGHIPFASQSKLEELTNGELKSDWEKR